jgi:phosphohistidine phosphatase
MELIFIRHAEAKSGASYADDFMRALTAKGRQVQEQVARELQRRGFCPDVILSSPRLRAEQTAWITAQVLPGDVPVIEVPELDGGYAIEDLLGRLQAYLDCHCIVCVGHEPDVTFWTNRLLADDQRQVSGFSTSGAASLQFQHEPVIGNGRSNYFYTADDLLLK